MLDTIIIADSVPHRARQIRDLAQNKAHAIRIIELREDDVDDNRYCFARQVWGVLNEGKSLMVIFNMIALTKTNLIEILKSIERCTKTGSRRIFVSCKGSHAFKRAIKSKGFQREEFRRIGYDKEGNYLSEIADLFSEENVITHPPSL